MTGEKDVRETGVTTEVKNEKDVKLGSRLTAVKDAPKVETRHSQEEHDALLLNMNTLQDGRPFDAIPLNDPFWAAQNEYQTYMSNLKMHHP